MHIVLIIHVTNYINTKNTLIMKSTDYILSKLENLLVLFHNVKVRYEYNDFANIHTIEVVPNEMFYFNEDYKNWEQATIDDFIRNYPTENICFISDDALVGIVNPSYENRGHYYIEDVKQTVSV